MSMQPKEAAKAYIYTRVSTAMQVDGYSLSAQSDELQRYASLKNIQIVGEYCDEGKSGKNDKRPEFQRMLQDIKNKKDGVRYVLVFKMSRFARNANDTLKNVSFLKEYGADLICVKEGLDSSEATGKLMLTIMSAVAEMELENIHAQTMAGRRQKAKEGKWNGGFAPYGYSLVNGELVINETEAAHIRYIYDLFTKEHLGALGVAKRMNAEGIQKASRTNSKHSVFTDNFVKRVLDDDVYVGKISYGKRTTTSKSDKSYAVKQKDESKIIRADGIHEPIISEEQWELARTKREKTGVRREKKKDGHIYLLSGLVKCPSCGKSMYGVPNNSGGKRNKNGEKYAPSYSYKCRTTAARSGYDCPDSHQYPEKKLDSEVIKAIQQMVFQPEYVMRIKEQLQSGSSVDELVVKQKQLNSKRAELIAKQKKFETELFALDVMDRNYDKHNARLTKFIDEIYDQVSIVDDELANVESMIKMARDNATIIEKAFDSVMDFSCNFPTMDVKKQKEILGAMVERIEIFPTKRDNGYLKKIYFHIPLFPDDKGNCFTIWDMFPGLLDENGNEKAVPDLDMEYDFQEIYDMMPDEVRAEFPDHKKDTDESIVCLVKQ